MPETLRPGKLPGDLLESLLKRFRTRQDHSVIIPPSYGFDASAILVGSETLVVKSDPITFTTDHPARYLVAVNSNDLACLGAVPRWMTVVSLLPESATDNDVECQFSELRDACDDAGISLIGGHTEVTIGLPRPLLIGTLIGVAGPQGILAPGHARAGDALYLTGSAGLEGTAIIAAELGDQLEGTVDSQHVRTAQEILTSPGIAIGKTANALIASGTIHAMHDPTEGGIATAVHELAGASRLGAEIDADAIPIRADTRAFCETLHLDPLGLLSSGAIVFAADPVDEPTLRTVCESVGTPLARIGTLLEQSAGLDMCRSGARLPLPRYDADELTRVL